MELGEVAEVIAGQSPEGKYYNEEEQEKIIEANKKLIGIMEQKIADVLREI